MARNQSELAALLQEVRACALCQAHLPLGPRPIIQADPEARLLVVGQAPGIKVHNSGVPWDDASGDRLRDWLGMDKARFYGKSVAIVPMGFCYPGRGKSGDLPPRKECAETWHARILQQLPKIETTLLIGTYAQKQYLEQAKPTLTQTVQSFAQYLPRFLPLPHPSPRNNIWLKKNPWFEAEVLPALRAKLQH